jgi:hypothetical protein
MRKTRISLILIISFVLIFLFSFNLKVYGENTFDFGIGLFGIDIKYGFTNLFMGNDSFNIYGSLGYYTDYYFNNIVNNLVSPYSGNVSNIKTNYFNIGAKFEYSFFPLPFMGINIFFANQSYVYFNSGINYKNNNYLDKQFYYLNRFSINPFILLIRKMEGNNILNAWIIDFNLSFYPKGIQNPNLSDNLFRYSITSYIKLTLLNSQNFNISFYNLSIYDKMNKEFNVPFIINTIEGGVILSKFHNYYKNINSAIRGVNVEKYGFYFENDEKIFINNDVRFLMGEGLIKYGLIFYYDIYSSNSQFVNYLNSTGVGVVIELAGFPIVVYYNYFINYKEGGFSFSFGYKM